MEWLLQQIPNKFSIPLELESMQTLVLIWEQAMHIVVETYALMIAPWTSSRPFFWTRPGQARGGVRLGGEGWSMDVTWSVLD